MSNIAKRTAETAVAIACTVAECQASELAIGDALNALKVQHKNAARDMFDVFSRKAWQGQTKDTIKAEIMPEWKKGFEATMRERRGDKWFNTKQGKTTKGRALMSTQANYFLKVAVAITHGLLTDAKGEAESIRQLYKLLDKAKVHVPGWSEPKAATPKKDAQADNADKRGNDAAAEELDEAAAYLKAVETLIGDDNVTTADGLAYALDHAEELTKLVSQFITKGMAARKHQKAA